MEPLNNSSKTPDPLKSTQNSPSKSRSFGKDFVQMNNEMPSSLMNLFNTSTDNSNAPITQRRRGLSNVDREQFLRALGEEESKQPLHEFSSQPTQPLALQTPDPIDETAMHSFIATCVRSITDSYENLTSGQIDLDFTKKIYPVNPETSLKAREQEVISLPLVATNIESKRSSKEEKKELKSYFPFSWNLNLFIPVYEKRALALINELESKLSTSSNLSHKKNFEVLKAWIVKLLNTDVSQITTTLDHIESPSLKKCLTTIFGGTGALSWYKTYKTAHNFSKTESLIILLKHQFLTNAHFGRPLTENEILALKKCKKSDILKESSLPSQAKTTNKEKKLPPNELFIKESKTKTEQENPNKTVKEGKAEIPVGECYDLFNILEILPLLNKQELNPDDRFKNDDALAFMFSCLTEDAYAITLPLLKEVVPDPALTFTDAMSPRHTKGLPINNGFLNSLTKVIKSNDKAGNLRTEVSRNLCMQIHYTNPKNKKTVNIGTLSFEVYFTYENGKKSVEIVPHAFFEEQKSISDEKTQLLFWKSVLSPIQDHMLLEEHVKLKESLTDTLTRLKDKMNFNKK